MGDLSESKSIDANAKAFKNSVEELFLVPFGSNKPPVDVIDKSIVYTLGSSAASFYDAGGRNIVNYLDPKQKSALLDAAAKSGILNPVKPSGSDEVSDVNSSDSDEGWNVAVGEDTFDFYDIIKSSYYDGFDKKKSNGDSVDPIYVFEFLDWLGFFNCTDEKVQIKIRHTVYDEIIGMVMDRNVALLDNSYKYAVNKDSFETMTGIKSKFYDIQKKSIKNEGFSNQVFDDLSFFDKYFKMYLGGNKELYDTALGNLSTLVIPDNNHLFIPSLRNIYKYFGKISRSMRTVLDVYISKKLRMDLSGLEDVIDLFIALGIRSNIHDNGYEDNVVSCLLEEPFDNLDDLIEVLKDIRNSDELPEKIKISVLGYLKNYQTHLGNIDGGVVANYVSIGAIGEYIEACRAFFGDNFDFMLLKDSAVTSLEKTDWSSKYANPWDSVVPLTETMSPDMKRHFWSEVFEEVDDRFYKELKSGDFDAVPFLNDVMGPDAEPLKEALKKCYVNYRTPHADFYQYKDTHPGGFLSLVKNYHLVCGEYPEHFIEGFQKNVGLTIDMLILDVKNKSNNHKDMQLRAKKIKDALQLLGEPVLKLLPELRGKVDALSKIDSELALMLIPREWVAENNMIKAVS